MKSLQISNFEVKLDFRFQSATLPLPPESEKLADLELSSQVALFDFRFQSANLPPLPKWKVGRFGNFKSS